MRWLMVPWLAAACLAAPWLASAQPEEARPAAMRSGPYLALLAGAFLPVDDSLEGFHRGPSLEGALGYAFSDRAALELGSGWYGSSTGMSGSNWLDLGIVPVTLNLKVLMPVPSASLFGEMGLGAYFTSMHGVGPPDPGNPTSQAVSDSDRKLGVHFGAGAEFFLGRNLGLLVDIRYAIVSSTFFGIGGYLNGVRLSAGLQVRFGGGAPASSGGGEPPHEPPGS